MFRAVLVVSAMAVVIAAASVGVITAMARSGSSHASHTATSAPAGRAATATAPETAAAAWVMAQVSRSTVISCDPAMCATLKAHGYPAQNLRPLSVEATLKKSAVVVVTPAAQQLFGSSLVTAWAPAALATFGSGTSALSVRIVAPNGAAAYEREAGQDQAARAASEGALTPTKSVAVSGAAAQDLKSGRVDGRLMEAIADAATAEPIDIVDFGNVGTGASADVPLRYADLVASGSAAGMSEPAYVQALRSGMRSGAGLRPDRTELVTLHGQKVLRVEFLAPSPFGVLNSS